MAIMIPRHPKEFDPKSREDEVFNALQNLPNDYYVFHSVSLLKVFKNYEYNGDYIREERQTDFVVFHPQRGIVCIEAKNWRDLSYNNGLNGLEEGWYLNGKLYENARYDGPFEQATSFCRDFRDRLSASSNNYVRDAIYKSKVLPAVWLISKHENDIQTMPLPADVERGSILSFEDLFDSKALEEKINGIFNTRVYFNGYEVNHFAPLSSIESTALISAIAPNFTISFERYAQETNEIVFNQLLKQQYAILDFLQEQDTAVISGLAGTGKTMLATRKAEIHAENGEKVLYLCFNSALANQLKNDYARDNVTYSSLDDYCCSLCGHGFNRDRKNDFYDECLGILQNIDFDKYPYKHVILDEGQDIRINHKIEEILEIIKTIIEIKEGTFYIFYDKMQLMPYTDRDHSGKLPKIITDADCKLTLYRNCRNTIKIARSAAVTITPKPPLMMETAPDGDNPMICYCEDVLSIKEKTERTISDLLQKGYARKDIVVLSLKGEDSKMSIGNDKVNDVRYLTINRFKGLEAKVVIIVDFDEHTFDSEENCTLYYVAASRAREKLYVFTTMTDADASRINRQVFRWYIRGDNPDRRINEINDRRSFETALGLRRIVVNDELL